MLSLLLMLACDLEPEALPTAVEVAEAEAGMDRAATPPLYQLLYDYAFLPEAQYSQQRVRILLWLVHMELSEYQLRLLAEAHGAAGREHTRVEEAQRAMVLEREPELAAVYDAIWTELAAGSGLDDPAVLAQAAPLTEARMHKELERELLQLRLTAVEEVLRIEQVFLGSLSPQQEARVADSAFFLRHKLDPYANPGDFNALIGTTFTAGDYATLRRGSFDPETDHLDLAGLWSEPDDPDRERGVFADVQRELVVFMILQEPALPEAIEAALARPAGAGAPSPERGLRAPGDPSGAPEPAPPGAQGGPAEGADG
jgi:hypothetical protein